MAGRKIRDQYQNTPINRYRTKAKVPLRELAAAAGISIAKASRICNGLVECEVSAAMKLVAFSVTKPAADGTTLGLNDFLPQEAAA